MVKQFKKADAILTLVLKASASFALTALAIFLLSAETSHQSTAKDLKASHTFDVSRNFEHTGPSCGIPFSSKTVKQSALPKSDDFSSEKSIQAAHTNIVKLKETADFNTQTYPFAYDERLPVTDSTSSPYAWSKNG